MWLTESLMSKIKPLVENSQIDLSVQSEATDTSGQGQRGQYRVYIAGPMKGLPEHNYPAFHAAAKTWREAGYAVLNPAELSGPDLNRPWHEYMVVDIMVIMKACDALVVLPGWRNSDGARTEVFLAKLFKLPIMEADSRQVISPEVKLVIDGDEWVL